MKNWKSIEKRSLSLHVFHRSWKAPCESATSKTSWTGQSTSIPLNIAEGNGKYAPKDRCRFFDIAHGSALECAAGLDILVAKAKLMPDQIRPEKKGFKESSACSWA
jgi:four helix bundle protein